MKDRESGAGAVFIFSRLPVSRIAFRLYPAYMGRLGDERSTGYFMMRFEPVVTGKVLGKASAPAIWQTLFGQFWIGKPEDVHRKKPDPLPSRAR